MGKIDRLQNATEEKQGLYEKRGAFKQRASTKDLTDANLGQDITFSVMKLQKPENLNFEEQYAEMLIHFRKLYVMLCKPFG